MNMIGIRMSRMRTALGMQQKALAVELGVSISTISRYEKGIIIPRADRVERIAAALRCDAALLMAPAHEAITITVQFGKLPPTGT